MLDGWTCFSSQYCGVLAAYDDLNGGVQKNLSALGVFERKIEDELTAAARLRRLS